MEIDCASLPEQLVESELFGHERGAFTDAYQTKKGLFELAAGGSIFLDEIGDMPLATQAKLLRAIENRRFKRIGGLNDLTLDAALIAATNKNLTQLVSQGLFRSDLFFRLNVIPVQMPSLRERPSDIAPLTHHFIERFNNQLHRDIKGVTKEALHTLVNYPWPGNVRELRNMIEHIMILHDNLDVIDVEHVPDEIKNAPQSASPSSVMLPLDGVMLEQVEKDLIEQALIRTGGNQSQAAKLLGISRFALRYRLKKYQTAAPN
jgi:transcriptional regulator with PAS, ATPase and Fis domain